MIKSEILILLVYAYIIIQVVSYNQKIVNRLNQIDKYSLKKLITNENDNLKITLYSSIIGVGIFYFYFSFLSFLLFFLLTCIVIHSFHNLIKNLNKKGL